MILVLASRTDFVARRLVSGWRAAGEPAELLVCADLCRRGWRVGMPDGPDMATVGSRAIPVASLRGVVVRLPAVTIQELPAIHPDDRAYAASEVHAFLLAWLSGLACPLLNRPTPVSLVGPGWSREQWVAFAAHHKVKVEPVVVDAVLEAAPKDGAKKSSEKKDTEKKDTEKKASDPKDREKSGSEDDEGPDARPAPAAKPQVHAEEIVHVVGERAFGSVDDHARRAALKLARAAHVELLRVRFAPGEKRAAPIFRDADPWVDVDQPEIADAIRARCQP